MFSPTHSSLLQVEVFLKLDFAETGVSAKWCQGFRETKMPNGGTVLLAVLNLCVPIKTGVATFDANHSVADSTRTVNRCFIPEAA